VIRKPSPLLCELHAHTTWSDGALTTGELVDLYGQSGFDVLCVTDHTVRADDPWGARQRRGSSVGEGDYAAYLADVEAEALRARALYDLLVVPGLELTYNDQDPSIAAHAVAVGLRTFIGVDGGLDDALTAARGAGAALVAAHPSPLEEALRTTRRTARFALAWRELATAVDRFELFNRHDLYRWVADARLPAVATGDFHTPEHLATWKTLLPCRKDEEAVVGYLRSPFPAYLVRLEQSLRAPALAA
jgi:hypothetical protein